MRRMFVTLGVVVILAATLGAANTNTPTVEESTTNCTPFLTPVSCINIIGSGLHVTRVGQGVRPPFAKWVKGRHRVQKDGSEWLQSGIRELFGFGDWTWFYWYMDRWFPDGTVLCGYFGDPDIAGHKACATIHD